MHFFAVAARLRRENFTLKGMLHGTIRNNDFQRIPTEQCNIVVTLFLVGSTLFNLNSLFKLRFNHRPCPSIKVPTVNERGSAREVVSASGGTGLS